MLPLIGYWERLDIWWDRNTDVTWGHFQIERGAPMGLHYHFILKYWEPEVPRELNYQNLSRERNSLGYWGGGHPNSRVGVSSPPTLFSPLRWLLSDLAVDYFLVFALKLVPRWSGSAGKLLNIERKRWQRLTILLVLIFVDTFLISILLVCPMASSTTATYSSPSYHLIYVYLSFNRRRQLIIQKISRT